MKMYDRQGAVHDIPDEDAQAAFQSGDYGFAPDATLPVITASGKMGRIQAADADDLFSKGARLLTSDEAHKAEVDAKYGSGLGNAAAATGEAFARGLLGGFSDPIAIHLAKGLFGDEAGEEVREHLAGEKEAHPWLAGGAEAAGFIAPMLTGAGEAELAAKGGAEALAKGGAEAVAGGAEAAEGAQAATAAAEAAPAAPGVVSRARGAVGGAVRQLGVAPRLLSGAGELTERGIAKIIGKDAAGYAARTAQRVAARAGAGAVEGALFGVESEIDEDVLGDHDLNAEKLVQAAGHGVLLGGGTAGILTGAGELAREVAGRSSPMLRKLVGWNTWKAASPTKAISERALKRFPGGAMAAGAEVFDEGVLEGATTADELFANTQKAAARRGAEIGAVTKGSPAETRLAVLLKPIDDAIAEQKGKAGFEGVVKSLQDFKRSLIGILAPDAANRAAAEFERAPLGPLSAEEQQAIVDRYPGIFDDEKLQEKLGLKLKATGANPPAPETEYRVGINPNAGLEAAPEAAGTPIEFGAKVPAAYYRVGVDPYAGLEGAEALGSPIDFGAELRGRRAIDKAVAEVDQLGVKNASYLREGYRDMAEARGAYSGVTPAQANEIATGRAPAVNSGKTLPPITVKLDEGEIHLVDGRHRLMAAEEAGASQIRAKVYATNKAGRKLETEAVVSINGAPARISPKMVEGADVGTSPVAFAPARGARINPKMVEGADIGAAPFRISPEQVPVAGQQAAAPFWLHRVANVGAPEITPEALTKAVLDTKVPIQKFIEQRQSLGRLAYLENRQLDPKMRVDVLRHVYGKWTDIENDMLDAATRATGKGPLKAEIVALKRRYQALMLYQDALANSNARYMTNRNLSMSDYLMALGSIAAGHPMYGAVSALAHKIIRERGNAWAAKILSRLSTYGAIDRAASVVDRDIERGVAGFFRPGERAAPRIRARVLGDYATRVDTIARAAAAPDVHEDNANRVADSIRAHAPQTANSFTRTALGVTAYLASKIPQGHMPTNTLSPGVEKPRVSEADKSKFNRTVDIAHDPVGVTFARMTKGMLTKSDVEDLRSMYPKTYAQIHDQAVEALTSHTKKLDFNQRMQLGILLNLPADVALGPMLPTLQQTFGPPAPEDQPQDRGTPPKRELKDMARQVGLASGLSDSLAD